MQGQRLQIVQIPELVMEFELPWTQGHGAYFIIAKRHQAERMRLLVLDDEEPTVGKLLDGRRFVDARQGPESGYECVRHGWHCRAVLALWPIQSSRGTRPRTA